MFELKIKSKGAFFFFSFSFNSLLMLIMRKIVLADQQIQQLG